MLRLVLIVFALWGLASLTLAQTTLDGAPFRADWRVFKPQDLTVTVDSSGACTIGTPLAPTKLNLEGQAGGGYWKTVTATPLPNDGGLAIEGVTAAGVSVRERIEVAEGVVRLICESDRALPLRGGFPSAQEANWFWARSAEGEVQGELWGTYPPLELREVLEFTAQSRRVRLALPAGNTLTVTAPTSLYEGARFLVSSVPVAGAAATFRTGIEIRNLPPEQAPLPDPDLPVVTKPFDPRNLVTSPVPQYFNAGFAPQDFQPFPGPPAIILVPAKGHPAIFKRGEALVFRTRDNLPADTALTFRCVRSLDDSVAQTGPLAAPVEGQRTLSLAPQPPGPYRLEVYSGDKKIGEEEFVVVGPVEQRRVSPLEENPFELQLVDEIDCATDRTHEFYCVSNEARIAELPGVGRFLEDPAEHKSGFAPLEWMAYRVGGLTPDVPHVLEVEFPDVDDMLMTWEVLHLRMPRPLPLDAQGQPDTSLAVARQHLATLGGGGNNIVEVMTSGVITGLGRPVTNTVQRVRCVFYPGDTWAVLHFMNYCQEQKPMRLTRLRVYRVLNDLPMVEPGAAGQDRVFGCYDEWAREVIHDFAVAGVVRGEVGTQGNPRYELYYKYWYLAAQRMVKYLRFRGENTYFAGAHRYGTALYPSLTARNGEIAGWKDPYALLARVFEENGLTLVLTTAPGPPYSLKQRDRYTDWDVRLGAPTLCQVTAGGFQPGGLMGREFNPLQPEVQRLYQGTLAEMAERYDDYPAVKALMLIGGHNGAFFPAYHTYSPWGIFTPTYQADDNYFGATYDDYTIGLFEQETGIKVPVADPAKRFTERRDFLLANARQEWTDFRCRQMLKVRQGLAEAVRAKSKRLPLYVVDYWHHNEWAFARDADPLQVKLKKIGTDLDLYAQPQPFVYGFFFNELNGYHESHMSGMPREYRESLRQQNLDPSTTAFLGNTENLGAYLGRQFMESEGKPIDPARPWYYDHSVSSCKYPLPAGRGALEDFALILSRSTPLYLVNFWVDGNLPQGHDEQIREFGLAYRSIPLGKYRAVFGSGCAGLTVRVREGQEPVAFYVVNTADQPRTLVLHAAGALKELTVSRQRVAQEGDRYEVVLPPYAVKVFELTGGQLGQMNEVRGG